MADLHPDIVAAIKGLSRTPLGRRYDRFTRKRYGKPGTIVAGKTVSGENPSGKGVSSAGARGYTQFIPSTRKYMIQKYGVDPWAGPKQAIKAMELYQLEGKRGIEGYNPGMPTYKNYILGQKLNGADKRALRAGGSGPTGTGPRVSLQSSTIPGQSFEAEREQAKATLLLDGRPLSLDKLLNYKRTINSLQDVPDQVTKSLKVSPGRRASSVGGGGRPGTVAPNGGKVIGTPHSGTHTLGNWQSDNAIDIAMPTGSIIDVPEDAVVEKVGGSYKGGKSRFDGYQVTVRLKDGNRLFYTHLSRANVKPGQRLRAGKVIGRSGAANGVEHLHLGAEHGNPKRYYRR